VIRRFALGGLIVFTVLFIQAELRESELINPVEVQDGQR
jgi:hypothetical protein